MSQLGISVPNNGSTLNKVLTGDLNEKNPSTLQQQMNAFGVDSGILPDSHYD